MISIPKRRAIEDLMKDDSFFLFPGASLVHRNGDVTFPFRQDSNILLLTEVKSPDIVLTCMKHQGMCEWKIFSDPLTPHEKLWGTERLQASEIAAISGIASVVPLMGLIPYITSSMSDTSILYTPQSIDNPYLEEFRMYECEFLPIHDLLESSRMIKLPEEIEHIKSAINITHEAYNLVKESIIVGMYEYEIEACIAGLFRSHHLIEAYPTIVGSGPNACTLHYTRHDRQIEDGDLILVDFGAEYMGYASDITRVFVAGQANKRQQEVYDSVLCVKEYAQSLILPGVIKSDYELHVREKMNTLLEKLGLIPEGTSTDEREKLSRKYFPHSVSHFLGLDVHDVGGRDTIFAPGMVITCEPGIYIEEEGIGIRLEDDILVTREGCENLSQAIPCILEK